MNTSEPMTRPAAVAGRFYEADADACRADAQRLCRGALANSDAAPGSVLAAVVPHAGWVCSGRIAGGTFAAIEPRTPARTFVITGSVHTIDLHRPAAESSAAWTTPLGDVPVDVALRSALAGLSFVDTLDAAHEHEHAIEVQLPLMQCVFGDRLRIVPIMIPPRADAPAWGDAIGALLRDWPQPVAMICSSDLTHYGPAYRFTPHGKGEAGHRWAHEVNDRRMLAMLESLDAEAIVYEAAAHRSACGGGALAATVAAARAMGATRGVVLEHTNSAAELAAIGYGDRESSVGYAGVAFGR